MGGGVAGGVVLSHYYAPIWEGQYLVRDSSLRTFAANKHLLIGGKRRSRGMSLLQLSAPSERANEVSTAWLLPRRESMHLPPNVIPVLLLCYGVSPQHRVFADTPVTVKCVLRVIVLLALPIC